MKGLTDQYIRFGEWTLNLFLLNLLWTAFSLLGCFVLGIFPATAAMFAVLRKRIFVPDEEVSIIKFYWNAFKREFWKSNLIGYIYLFVGTILFVDIKVIQQLNFTLLHQFIFYALILIFFVYLLTFLYIFPIFVHFQMKTFSYIKCSFILVIGKPLLSLCLIIGLMIIYYLFQLLPGLIPVFGVSLVAFLLMKIAALSFPQIKTLNSNIEC